MAQAKARLRHLRMAPRKVRLVARVASGLPVQEAEAQLLHLTKRAAHPVIKLLRSAVANAREKKLNEKLLKVSEIRVDQGPILKRFLPRAKGMATPIHKKTSHVTITVSEADAEPKMRFVMIKKEKPKRGDRRSGAARMSKKAAPKVAPEAEKKAAAEEPGITRRIFRRKSV
jgi:large subunit ribosomal protein L22